MQAVGSGVHATEQLTPVQFEAKPEEAELDVPLEVFAPRLQELHLSTVSVSDRTTLPSSLHLVTSSRFSTLPPALSRCRELKHIGCSSGEFPSVDVVDRNWPRLASVLWVAPCSTTDRNIRALQSVRPSLRVEYFVTPESIQESRVKLELLNIAEWDPSGELPWKRWSALSIDLATSESFDFDRVKEADLLAAGVKELHISAKTSSLSRMTGSRFAWSVRPAGGDLLAVVLSWTR